MYRLFGKLFVKNYKDLDNEIVRANYGIMANIIGIVSNMLLGLLKIVLGIITFSISIITDAVNNVTDSLSSIISIVGYKLSKKEADEDHPFGHQRIEFIAGLIISVLMFSVAILLLKESISKIFTPNDVSFDLITIIILGISIVVKLLQGLFYNSVGKAISSLTLKASSKDSINDTISTIAIIIGVIIYVIWNVNVDGYIGTIISIYVIISSIKLIIETSDPLIGTIPPKEEIDKYKNIIKSYDGILGVHDIVCHTYGPTKLFMTAHAEVSSSVSSLISHDIIDNIEYDFRVKYNIDLTIHMDPIDDKDEYTINLRDEFRKRIKEIDERMDIHDFRIVKGDTHTNVLFDCEIPIDSKYSKNEMREKIQRLASEIDPKLITVIQVDQMYDRK